MGRKDGQQRRQEADQVEVVQVTRLLQQEDVGEHQAETGRADPVQEPQGDEAGENPHQGEVEVHPVPGPGAQEIQRPVGEVEILA